MKTFIALVVMAFCAYGFLLGLVGIATGRVPRINLKGRKPALYFSLGTVLLFFLTPVLVGTNDFNNLTIPPEMTTSQTNTPVSQTPQKVAPTPNTPSEAPTVETATKPLPKPEAPKPIIKPIPKPVVQPRAINYGELLATIISRNQGYAPLSPKRTESYEDHVEYAYKLPNLAEEVVVIRRKQNNAYWVITLSNPKLDSTKIVGTSIDSLEVGDTRIKVQVTSGKFNGAIVVQDSKITTPTGIHVPAVTMIYSHAAALENGIIP
jgi:hypothetical protein